MGTWIRSERVVLPEGVRAATVIVEGERIAEICDVPPAGPGVDLGDRVLMPGVVDSHVHVNEPGRTDWEGFWTATRAAAAGGVTTVVDMPLNCIPVTTSAEALAVKLEACTPQLWCDVGFWGGVIPGNADALGPLIAAGALGCKAFLCESGIPEFPASDRTVLRAAMQRLREAGAPLLAHAELELGAHVHETDPRRYAAYLQSRPPAWEDAAIALLIELARETGCAVHIVHLSSADSLPQLARARAEGVPITVETCAHYLCLRAEDVPDGDTTFKCAPPIRDDDNRTRLWQGLRDGVIDLVVTDHSPCTPQLKDRERGDFMAAWGGIASLQLGLPSVWTEARARGFGLDAIARWLAERPAALAGLGSRKGRIAAGFDADLVAWDPERELRVRPEDLQFRHKCSPYLGRTLAGVVERTWLRGRIVYDGGSFVAAAQGRPILHRDDRSGSRA